ncbi:exopolysaccharide production protein ExoZ (plasmid) [Sinorhizobium americanum]|uniref:Exopolysaccharide production protein ExoZ n=1 Tax=Sinorhizobium americanum TaxID=194963 RepID=A0A1L3LT59_9HYPH|nr:exopolysaccharide production protein ExoZ [Sinorhizobium americanum CCGM7]APG93281.1 exopolysaccharide production protein ExoZ [Sinorhizobium americanum]
MVFGLALTALAFGGFALVDILHLPFDEWMIGPLAVLLVLSALTLEAAGRVPSLRVPSLLGNASYSIYLWPTFAISLAAKAVATFNLD